jgi:hypothetical protein
MERSRMNDTHRAPAFATLVALSAAAGLAPGLACAQADPLKIAQIEQDLRDLRRTVEAQGRQLEALGARPAPVPRPTPPVPAPRSGDERWLKSANWARVREGLGELDVIAALGPPTAMRASDDGRRRTLYYALEIGTSGYLGGQVTLEDRRVVQVEAPRLR